MTELSVNNFLRVSMRCCATRSLSSCHPDLFMNYPLMFLDSIFELPLLVMQGTVSLIPPVITDSMNEVLRVLEETQAVVQDFLRR